MIGCACVWLRWLRAWPHTLLSAQLAVQLAAEGGGCCALHTPRPLLTLYMYIMKLRGVKHGGRGMRRKRQQAAAGAAAAAARQGARGGVCVRR
jgi:hypothetical protein